MTSELIKSPRNFQEALSLIISTAYTKNLFANYSGHVHLIRVYYYPGGYESNPEGHTVIGEVYLDYQDSLSQLIDLHNKMLEV